MHAFPCRPQSHPVLWLDCETGGTDPERHALLQVAGLIEMPGISDVEFEYKIRPFPDDGVEDAALQVNGFDREAVRGFYDPSIVHDVLLRHFGFAVNCFNRADKMIFAGYNAQFDLNFMHAFFRKCGDPYFGSWVWWPGLDVAVLAMERLRFVRHHLPNFKLGTVAAFLGIEAQGDLHDALTDVRLTRNVYRRLQTFNQC